MKRKIKVTLRVKGRQINRKYIENTWQHSTYPFKLVIRVTVQNSRIVKAHDRLNEC